jgi:ABC-2 type transport system permease protein
MDGILVQKPGDNPPDLLKPLFTANIAQINKGLQKQFRDSVGVSMPTVAGLTYTKGGPFLIKPLLMTDTSLNWNKKGKLVVDSAAVTFSPADGDSKTAVPTVLALTRHINNKEQRIIVAGDADFLSNREFSRPRVANFVFSIDIFGWFANGQFPIDTDRPESKDTHLNITDKGLYALKVLFLGILPAVLGVIALVFLIRRKRK